LGIGLAIIYINIGIIYKDDIRILTKEYIVRMIIKYVSIDIKDSNKEKPAAVNVQNEQKIDGRKIRNKKTDKTNEFAKQNKKA
jgi:hypothetical protein